MTTDLLPTYIGPDGREHRNPWVDVIFVQDVYAFEEEDQVLATAYREGDLDAVVDYLAAWDYGTETDQAHTTDDDPHNPPGFDRAHDIQLAPGQDYVLVVNRQLDYLALYRRPLDWEDGAFAS